MTNTISITLLYCALLIMTTTTTSIHAATTDSAQNAEQVSLASLQWKHRVVIAFTHNGDSQALLFKEWVEANTCGLDERDVHVHLVTDGQSMALHGPDYSLDDASVQLLVQRRKHADQLFEMVLLGKDGGIKAYATAASALTEFMTRIDGMPMRRSEASDQSSGCQ